MVKGFPTEKATVAKERVKEGALQWGGGGSSGTNCLTSNKKKDDEPISIIQKWSDLQPQNYTAISHFQTHYPCHLV